MRGGGGGVQERPSARVSVRASERMNQWARSGRGETLWTEGGGGGRER